MTQLNKVANQQRTNATQLNQIIDALEGLAPFSASFSGSVTATAFVGDGSGITNVVASLGNSEVDGGIF